MWKGRGLGHWFLGLTQLLLCPYDVIVTYYQEPILEFLIPDMPLRKPKQGDWHLSVNKKNLKTPHPRCEGFFNMRLVKQK